MCADDTNLDPTPETNDSNDSNVDPTPETNDSQSDTSQDTPQTSSTWSWPRRKFLAAAAIGTAAAALIGKDGQGLRFGPATAGAAAPGTCTDPTGTTVPDLSFLSCTANDVNIVGTGIVQNEPCAGCTGGTTFSAQVQFQVQNNTGTDRYCIQISIGTGLAVPCQDVILENTNGSGSTASPGLNTMTGTIQGFPCNAAGGLVCLGAANTPASGACPSECVTVGWSTSSGSAGCTSPTKVPGGQCRHQQICIQGFGATLQCVDGCSTKNATNCSVACGANLYLNATASGGTLGANGTYTFTVAGPGGTTVASAPAGSASPQCFTIANPTTGTYTLTVTDSKGCSRTAAISATVSSAPTIAAPVLSSNPCTGLAVFSPGAVTGGTAPFTYSFSLDGGAFVTGATFTYKPKQDTTTGAIDTTCHSLVVKVTDKNGCTGTSPATTLSQCVSTTTGCTLPTP